MKRIEALKLTFDFRSVLEQYFQSKSYNIICGRHWRGLECSDVAKEVISVTMTNTRDKFYLRYPNIIHAQYTIKANSSSHLFPNFRLSPAQYSTGDKQKTIFDVISEFFKHGEIVNMYFCPLENKFSCCVKAYGKHFHLVFSFEIQRTNHGPVIFGS